MARVSAAEGCARDTVAPLPDTARMLIRELLAETTTPAGEAITLAREGGRYVVAIDNMVLMSSEQHGSEDALGSMVCASLRERPEARVVIGGLGMGFTVRAVLNELAEDAAVTVVEFLPALVEWNRTVLGPLAQEPLGDPRVTLELSDFVAWAKAARQQHDAILLDLDNGPEAFTTPGNAWLYSPAGLSALRSLLRPGGVLAIWSVDRSPRFEGRLRTAGFKAEMVAVRGRPAERKGSRHTIFLATKPGAA